MSLYEIVKSLQEAKGSNEKLAILMKNNQNELLRAYLKATYDPALSYYQKKAPKTESIGKYDFKDDTINAIVNEIASRILTGKNAIYRLTDIIRLHNKEGQELINLLISRSIGSGVGDTMILKAFPGLYFIPPYMRCSLLDAKSKSHFETLKKIYVQKKADGSFLYLVNSDDGDNKGFTRSGNAYPEWFVDKLLDGISGDDSGVFMGEALVVKDGVQLDRKTGNGILNSILSGDFEGGDYEFIMEAWDHLTVEEFEYGLSNRTYEQRFSAVQEILNQDEFNIRMIETDIVESLADALAISVKYTQAGFEGAILKDPSSPWKDHTSPFNVKVKIKFEADYKIDDIYEGEGKAKGMLGGISFSTSDDLLKCNVGTGFDDDTRKKLWSLGIDYLRNMIITVSANEVITKIGSTTVSLFLPAFEELRLDKTCADSLERVYEQLEAAKRGEFL